MFRPSKLTVLVLLAVIPACLSANNIQVGNVILTGQNTTDNKYQVQFDISWENSWRTSTAEANHDAAWVILKVRANNGPWQHGYVNTGGFVTPSGSVLQVASNTLGAYIYRSSDGIGNVSYVGAQLTWDYGSNGFADNDIFEVRVIAVEMVLVPQGAFKVGDGSTTNADRQFEVGQTGNPYTVASESAITLGGSGITSLNARNNAVVSASGTNDDFNYTTTQTLPANFPKGFNAFYMMKYEVTEGQYADFLNMITPTQAATNFPNQFGFDGATLANTGIAPNVYVTSSPERVLNGVSHQQAFAYADWACLRPMSELEWEKACRGVLFPVQKEYAWGNTGISPVAYTVANAGASNESVTLNALPSVNGGWSLVPVRVARAGMFAGSTAGATRTQAGAGYYGAMELSGSVAEHVVAIGSTAGRLFSGSVHGDGNLNANGTSDALTWPIGVTGVCARGGAYNTPFSLLRRFEVSNRSMANTSVSGLGAGARFCGPAQ